MQIHQSQDVNSIFLAYPPHIQEKMDNLRRIVIETAEENGISFLEETLKWGEPSYIAKKGSTIRMDWKERAPNQYAIYFICSTGLVNTFKKVFGNTFNYEGTRAIIFQLEDEIPETELKKCVLAALEYKNRKDLENLGL